MQSTIDIGWWQLSLFMLVLLVPLAINRYFDLQLGRDIGAAVLRMTLQLVLVGLYLQYLFELDNPWLNIAWLVLMMLVGASAIVSKAKLPQSRLYVPVLIGLGVGLLPILAVLLLCLLSPVPVYSAQYLIPTAGMLLGNSLSGNIMALQRLFGAFQDRQAEYEGALALGASVSQACQPFVQSALQLSFAPILASMATTGLVTLPGMMTGQILAGVDPMVAIKYQIIILVAIFATLSLSVSSSLLLCVRAGIETTGRVKVRPIS